MDPLYDVCFAGQLLDGHELQSVRDKVQTLFKANPETLEKLFSGKNQILKRECDKSTALKYKKAMEAAGAKPVIRACETAAAPEEARQEPSSSEQGLNLAPVGADVLRPDERDAPAHQDFDLSQIKLAATGTTLGETETANHQAPDTSHLSMGDVGEDIPGLPDTRTAVTPSTDNISLAPEGSDFSDCAAPGAADPELDLSSLQLAPAGADVLEEHYKKNGKASAPDTSHLELDP